MAKRRYRVKRGQTYIDIANATGVDIGALLQANSATPTPVGGFNVNIPTAPNVAGAPPPPPQTSGYDARQSIPAMGNLGYFTSPLTPAPISGTAGIGAAATPAPVWNPMGNAESAGRQNYMATTQATQVGGTPPPPPTGSYSANVVGDVAVMDATMNQMSLGISMTVTQQMVDSLAIYQGIPAEQMPEYMTAAGFTLDANGNWVRGAPTVEPRNAGGWQKMADGSWKRNQNQSQIRRKEERHQANKPGSSVSPTINWSL